MSWKFQSDFEQRTSNINDWFCGRGNDFSLLRQQINYSKNGYFFSLCSCEQSRMAECEAKENVCWTLKRLIESIHWTLRIALNAQPFFFFSRGFYFHSSDDGHLKVYTCTVIACNYHRLHFASLKRTRATFRIDFLLLNTRENRNNAKKNRNKNRLMQSMRKLRFFLLFQWCFEKIMKEMFVKMNFTLFFSQVRNEWRRMNRRIDLTESHILSTVTFRRRRVEIDLRSRPETIINKHLVIDEMVFLRR